MKITYESKRMGITFENEVPDSTAAFDFVAHTQEVFEQEKCGACGNTELRLSKRVVGKFTYREVRCTKCGCSLSMGLKLEDKSLFPNRKNKAGEIKGKYGWAKWSPDDDDEEDTPSAKTKR